MKKILYLFMLLVTVVAMSSCHGVEPNAGEEAVLVYKPWFVGSEGVDPEPVKTGLTWCAFSTESVIYKIIPEKHQVNIEDLMSTENTPLDCHSVIITKIKEGKSPILHQNYGVDWFDTNLFNYYSNRVRDYFSQYSPFDLMSNREILNNIDTKITKEMRDFVAQLSKDKEFPVEIVQVTVGKAIPNKEQLDEMNRTAKEVQAKQTEQRRAEAQKARGEAERQRAIADKAYMKEMNLSTEQFIQLKAWDVIEKKQGASIDVLFDGSSNKMWNIRR